jgi:hypothetical protein
VAISLAAMVAIRTNQREKSSGAQADFLDFGGSLLNALTRHLYPM